MSVPNIEVIFEDADRIVSHQFTGGNDLTTVMKIYQTCRLPFKGNEALPELTVKIKVNGTVKAVGYSLYEDTVTVCPDDLLERFNVDIADVLEAMPRQSSEPCGYLKQDRIQKGNEHRQWWITAWRVVDAYGNDIVKPWRVTKEDAKQAAADLGILVQDDRRKSERGN